VKGIPSGRGLQRTSISVHPRDVLIVIDGSLFGVLMGTPR
jgi:hypothetical protein